MRLDNSLQLPTDKTGPLIKNVVENGTKEGTSVGGHYVATILIGLGALFFMGAAQRLCATYYCKLSPEEYVWWWRVILGLEAVIWVIGIWPIGWLSLLIWIALYIRLPDEMKSTFRITERTCVPRQMDRTFLPDMEEPASASMRWESTANRQILRR